jgi:PAS domain S-box-containing protein
MEGTSHRTTVDAVPPAVRPEGDSQERLLGIIASATDAIITVDADQRVTLFNPAAERMFLCPASEALGRPLDRFIPSRFRDVHRAHVEEFGRTGVTNRAMGHQRPLAALRADGSEFPVEATISQVTVGGQKLFTAIVRDITERRRAEEALARQAEALARSNVELERFAYVASHDLQEPMRTVRSFAQLLQRRCGDQITGDAAEYLRFITDGVQRMQTLINDLLTYSRVSSQGGAFGPADSNQIVKMVLESLQASIGSARAEVTADPLPTVFGDATQLGQVFQNLIVNAIKFHGQAPPRIHVSAKEAPGEWVFSVRDNGIGIAPEYFERIFVIFQRLHTIEEYGGTGIGLAICKKIVERHGGRIWVESTVGEGSRFYFSIPKRERA